MTNPTRLRAIANGSAIFTSFLLLASALTWPLPLHLRSHLLGDPAGDTGVYVWNLWIFRHELLRHGHLPFSTDHVFSFTGGADFALHNYTPLAGLIGAPLISSLGLVATFNVLMIASVACSGYGLFVLGRRLGLGYLAAWAGGAVFIASPILTARETAHFSLVIAAPLPLFLWLLLRTLDELRVRDAILVGVACGAATYCDAYYGIYCLLMGAMIVGWRFVRIEVDHARPRSRRLEYAIDALLALLGALLAWRVISGTTDLTIAGIKIGMQTLYTPVLAVLGLGVWRIWITRRPAFHFSDPDRQLRKLAQLGGIAVTVCLALLTPILVGVAMRFLTKRLPGTEIYWRSSPRGVDLLAYVVPNPNHPSFGDVTRHWLLPDKPDAFPEFIGSFSIVAFVVVAVAAWRRALPPRWLMFTVCFALLSLGPFVHVGGVNTYIPGPWAFLRYVPIIGMARSPSRFAIVAALGMSLLFAHAVQDWVRARSHRTISRRIGIWLLTVALVLELVSIPRPLYSAAVPDVYQLIATTNDESGRLLELPTGIRDGTFSLGDFNASTQYFQTTHRRRLIGGYLSRVSRWRRMEDLRAPVLRGLFALGEGREISPTWKTEASASREAFLARSCVRYVIVNKRRATAGLRAFAVDTLRLTSVHEDPDYELLTPVDPPPCLGR
jgi:hypothetical protein